MSFLPMTSTVELDLDSIKKHHSWVWSQVQQTIHDPDMCDDIIRDSTDFNLSIHKDQCTSAFPKYNIQCGVAL